jgi:hypothetical protein
LYPAVTPVIMLRMVLRTLPSTAFLFFFCSHILNLRADFSDLEDLAL